MIVGIDWFMLEVCLFMNFFGNVVVIILVVLWIKIIDLFKVDEVLCGCDFFDELIMVDFYDEELFVVIFYGGGVLMNFVLCDFE